MSINKLEHKAGCAKPDSLRYYVGDRGDRMVKCEWCRRFAVVSAPSVPMVLEPPVRYFLPCAGCGIGLPHGNARPAVRRCEHCEKEHAKEVARLAEVRRYERLKRANRAQHYTYI